DDLGRALGSGAEVAAEQALVLGALVVEAGVVCQSLVDEFPVQPAAAAVADGVCQDPGRVAAWVVQRHAGRVDGYVGAVEVGVDGGASAGTRVGCRTPALGLGLVPAGSDLLDLCDHAVPVVVACQYQQQVAWSV